VHQTRDVDRTDLTNSAQIISKQVNNHQVLRSILQSARGKLPSVAEIITTMTNNTFFFFDNNIKQIARGSSPVSKLCWIERPSDRAVPMVRPSRTQSVTLGLCFEEPVTFWQCERYPWDHKMGALNFFPGQPRKWAPGIGGKEVLVESAPQRRLPNTRVVELPL